MNTYYLEGPLREEDVEQLKIGDSVYLSGEAFTCRSRLHRYIFDEGNRLPFSVAERNMLIHTGPIVVKEGNGWHLVSFMPTSSIRFEKWGAKSVEAWGLRLVCGKTTMGKETADMMQKMRCVHVSPQCVSPALWCPSISIQGVHLFDELGSIEAAWQIYMDKLGPFVVDIDCHGNNLFTQIENRVDENRQKAYDMLGIPGDFTYTKLY